MVKLKYFGHESMEASVPNTSLGLHHVGEQCREGQFETHTPCNMMDAWLF